MSDGDAGDRGVRTDGGAETARPVPDYELEQQFPGSTRDHSMRKRREIRRQYGYLRAFFRMRSERYGDVQRWLNQAHMGENVDTYLARAVRSAALAGLVAALLGAVVAVQLPWTAVTATFEAPAAVPDPLVGVMLANGALLVQATVIGASGLLTAGLAYLGQYYYPRLRVNSRRRNINLLLPHAIVYMYALSYGGLRPLRVIEELADADETYAEVAAEFDIIARDVELFGNDLLTAIQNARNTTPNENLEQFLDDLLGVLDSGGGLTDFLEEEAQTYRKQAKQEQSQFLETLEILSELFIVAFVAAPLFLVVTLVLIGLMGGQALFAASLLVYVLLPVGMLGFLLVVHYISIPFSTVRGADITDTADPLDAATNAPTVNAEQYDRYQFHRVAQLAWDLLRQPVGTLRQQTPFLSLALTLPVAAAVVVTLSASNPGPLPALYAADPIGVTTAFVVAPLVVVAAPLAVLYELQRRRINSIKRRFPDTLNLLASANQMGIPLPDAMDLVSRWSSGVIATELRKTHNDIQWSNNVQSALLALGERLGVPQIKRTMKLLATGTYSTSDLSKVLSIAAEDTRVRYELERARHDEMNAYIAIVAIGFLVYLGVVVLLDINYLTPIARMEVAASATGTQGRVAGSVLSMDEIPVQRFRTLFFHSALIQATGSGLLAGKLAENDLLAGLKYAIALVLVAVATFTVV